MNGLINFQLGLLNDTLGHAKAQAFAAFLSYLLYILFLLSYYKIIIKSQISENFLCQFCHHRSKHLHLQLCFVLYVKTEFPIYHSPWQCCLWRRRKCGCPLRRYRDRRWEQYDLSDCLWASYHWQSIKHRCATTIQNRERSNTLLLRLRTGRSFKPI